MEEEAFKRRIRRRGERLESIEKRSEEVGEKRRKGMRGGWKKKRFEVEETMKRERRRPREK